MIRATRPAARRSREARRRDARFAATRPVSPSAIRDVRGRSIRSSPYIRPRPRPAVCRRHRRVASTRLGIVRSGRFVMSGEHKTVIKYPSEYVKLNIGGSLHYTTIGTLQKHDTMLRAMFSGRMEVLTDSEGEASPYRRPRDRATLNVDQS